MSNSGLWEEDPGANRHLTVYAATSGTSGTFNLNSDIFYATVSKFIIPKGHDPGRCGPGSCLGLP